MHLLPLALSRPQEALTRARTVLAERPSALDAAVAHQSIGIVLREFGDIDAAIGELRLARTLARRAGSAPREADVLATLGVALVYAGRTAAGRRALDAATAGSTGHLQGRVRFRRGMVLLTLGLHREALDDLDAAVQALQAAGDTVWEARALTQRAVSNLALGSLRGAAADLEAAERLFTEAGQELELADAVVNRGILALRLGDLPDALARFDEAAERFERLGVPDYDLPVDRCSALLAAGLPRDALAEAQAAIAGMERQHVRPTRRAELLLVTASCALAAGEPAVALERATEAGRSFARQGRRWWLAHARLTRIRASLALGPATPRLLRDARRSVEELVAAGSPDALLGRLTAGRIALDLGRIAEAQDQLGTAAAGRHRGPALARAQAWLAEALRAQATGDTRRLLHACRQGLHVIHEHRSLLGSWELRAQVTAHGDELARLGQRCAAALDRPRELLAWSERWRAVAHAVPAVRPPDDEELQADLAAMRSVTHRLADGLAVRGSAVQQLERERQRLERAVQAKERRSRGTGAGAEGGTAVAGEVDVGSLLDLLGTDDRLVELAEVDGCLQVLVCGGGQVRRYRAGTVEAAMREVLFARFALTRIGSRSTPGPVDDAFAQVAALGADLERVLLGDAAAHLGGGRVVVVPPGRLHAVPWALLPTLGSRVVSIAPSATSWVRARRAADAARRGRDPGSRSVGRVVLVRGPGLMTEGQEVPRLAADYGPQVAPVVLGQGTATVAAVLEAMDGADLVHVAAHGTFRADSPLFSSLLLDDGPLTLYDLARLRHGPRRLVLSSCDSGVVAPVGADEILGLASSLLPLGTTGIVASVVPVDDEAVVPLMVHLHRRLLAGAGLAEALRDVRGAFAPAPTRSGDPDHDGPDHDGPDHDAPSVSAALAAATARSFIALGADPAT